MSTASNIVGTAAAAILVIASAARSVSAERGPSPAECAIDGTCCFLAKPAATRWKPASIEVVFERLTVGGGSNGFAVRRALRGQVARIEACFERAGADGVAVDATFVVGPAGSVHRAESKAVDPTRAACVSAALAHVRLPHTRDLALTTVSVTVRARRLP